MIGVGCGKERAATAARQGSPSRQAAPGTPMLSLRPPPPRPAVPFILRDSLTLRRQLQHHVSVRASVLPAIPIVQPNDNSIVDYQGAYNPRRPAGPRLRAGVRPKPTAQTDRQAVASLLPEYCGVRARASDDVGHHE